MCASLEGGMVGQFVIPALDYMRLTRVRGDSFVIVGFEEVWSRRESEVFPQAWWCRVVCQVTGRSAEIEEGEAEDLEAAVV